MNASSMELEALEKSLIKHFENYKGTDNLEQALNDECQKRLQTAKRITADDMDNIKSRVLSKLQKTEKNELGSKYGVAHDPVKQYNTMAKRISEMRF